MTFQVRRLVACLAIGVFALAVGSISAQDKKKDDKKKDEKKIPAIKEIMKKVPGKMGLAAQIKTAGSSGEWDKAQKIGKELKEYGEALGKNKPKKGDAESWEKQSTTFKENMTALADAADKKDKDALTDASKKFAASCGACHEAHK